MLAFIALKRECTVFRWKVIHPGFGAQLFHQGIACTFLNQFTEGNGFPGGSIGNRIFVAIAEPVYSVGTG